MRRLWVLYEMVRADFLERARRYSFLVTLAAALYVAYAIATEKLTIVIGDGYRGVYNSAWVGALMAVSCSTFLSLAGFYVVKGSVQRDSDTRVGQVLAATPMSRVFYTAAKALSNFAVLASMVAVLMAAAVGMQLLDGESHGLSLWELWSPFLFLTLPAMAMTAAVAVFFETVPLLRSGLGNVVYFFVWGIGIAAGVSTRSTEPTGIRLLFDDMHARLMPIDPRQPMSSSFSIGGARAAHTFYWPGVDWTARIVAGRAVWVLVAAGVSLVAAVFFHRFDPAREWRRRGPASAAVEAPVLVAAGSGVTGVGVASGIGVGSLSPVIRDGGGSGMAGLVAAELRLMLKGQRWWWYAVAAGLLVAEVFSPAVALGGLLTVAWIWPTLIWSQLGSREARGPTGSLIFSSPRALYRQLPAVWIAGVLVTVLTGGGVGLRLLLAANWPELAGWAGGVVFIPTLALALGIWTGSGKAFEALYVVWWYVGPAHQTPGLDFMGTTVQSSAGAGYLMAALVLLAVCFFGRRIRLAYA